MDRSARQRAAAAERLRSRLITVLGCVAVGTIGAWLLLERSEEDGSLVIRGPALSVDSLQVARYALRPQEAVAVPAPSGPVEEAPEVGASQPAPAPEPTVAPPPQPRRVPAPVVPLFEELPLSDEAEPSSDAGTTAAAAAEAEFPPLPPRPPPPPPHSPRGTNNAPIFD